MKNLLNAEKFDLADVLKRGLSVRDEIIKEFNGAREKLARVDWQKELETFKNNPLDVAQSYLNQVNDALRANSQATEAKTDDIKSVSKPKAKAAKRTSRTGTSTPKSPRASKTTAKKTAPKKTAAKKAQPGNAAAKKVSGTVKTTTRKRTTTTRSRTATKQ
jgi:DNA-binding protein HU-beta